MYLTSINERCALSRSVGERVRRQNVVIVRSKYARGRKGAVEYVDRRSFRRGVLNPFLVNIEVVSHGAAAVERGFSHDISEVPKYLSFKFF